MCFANFTCWLLLSLIINGGGTSIYRLGICVKVDFSILIQSILPCKNNIITTVSNLLCNPSRYHESIWTLQNYTRSFTAIEFWESPAIWPKFQIHLSLSVNWSRQWIAKTIPCTLLHRELLWRQEIIWTTFNILIPCWRSLNNSGEWPRFKRNKWHNLTISNWNSDSTSTLGSSGRFLKSLCLSLYFLVESL